VTTETHALDKFHDVFEDMQVRFALDFDAWRDARCCRQWNTVPTLFCSSACTTINASALSLVALLVCAGS
jgi:hypothetical protein